MIQPAYLNANNDSIKGIAVNDNSPNIRIEGVSYYAPDFKTPTVSNGPLGLTSTGPSTYVNGMLVIGKPGPWANIGIAHGSGQNCTAQVVYGCENGPYTSAAMSRSWLPESRRRGIEGSQPTVFECGPNRTFAPGACHGVSRSNAQTMAAERS